MYEIRRVYARIGSCALSPYACLLSKRGFVLDICDKESIRSFYGCSVGSRLGGIDLDISD